MPFKRFHQDARRTVILAREAARQLGDDQVGTEHLLLGLLDHRDNVSCRILARHGLTYDKAYQEVVKLHGGERDEQLDAQALESIGIDLAAVRDKLEAAFGKGVLDGPGEARRGRRGRLLFTNQAKKVVELSLRESIALKHTYIGDGHLLLGLLRDGGRATDVLKAAGIDPGALREEVIAEMQ
jgi:ATP-dependent Clp protease ATP-binding subunit ClpA